MCPLSCVVPLSYVVALCVSPLAVWLPPLAVWLPSVCPLSYVVALCVVAPCVSPLAVWLPSVCPPPPPLPPLAMWLTSVCPPWLPLSIHNLLLSFFHHRGYRTDLRRVDRESPLQKSRTEYIHESKWRKL